MKYARCLEKQDETKQVAIYFEREIELLEEVGDRELLESALGDVIEFFRNSKNEKKKRKYENKVVQLVNQ
ncbi:hypothetical protein [Salinibacillus xinjiangensis]|uniref:Uncharacterized protein n=1 Tax=Salinibacillus xinjiangensis TaxID=1229268 RepID=A0A6G1X945_9BACI|nr:hypothetical protein [Salinibacillus xinjiangensis]MRG87425.1 hypothetical protein [Salinibacillus xinjiangensis]